MISKGQRCGLCIYWQEDEQPRTPGSDIPQERAGNCRRYPPQLLVLIDVGIESGLSRETGQYETRPKITNNVRGLFPAMMESSIGCGEFIEKESSGDDEL